MIAMHKCLAYSELAVKVFDEEHPWGMALYVELRLSPRREVIVCRHPSYTAIEDLRGFAEEVYNVGGGDIDALVEIAKILDDVFPSWRKDFEVVIRRGFVSVSVYL